MTNRKRTSFATTLSKASSRETAAAVGHLRGSTATAFLLFGPGKVDFGVLIGGVAARLSTSVDEVQHTVLECL
jgi:hypothetical protein